MCKFCVSLSLIFGEIETSYLSENHSILAQITTKVITLMRPVSQKISSYDFLICRAKNEDTYSLYRMDLNAPELFSPVTTSSSGSGSASLGCSWKIAQVGGYLLQWNSAEGMVIPSGKGKGEVGYQFKLLKFDPTATDPLNDDTAVVRSGYWEKSKFWDYRKYYNADKDAGLDLIPMTSFVLSTIFTEGRGTYELWNFDPKYSAPHCQDPIPASYTGQGGFAQIKKGHTLIPIGNYVLDRSPNRKDFRLWSFDPQQTSPLSLPAVQVGHWPHIDEKSELVAIGDFVLECNLDKGNYRLWEFDPDHADVLIGPVREGALPAGIGRDPVLTGFQASIPVKTELANTPGTMDFMRSKIKHVVYYMLESRSFDNVCGWLYENGDKGCHFIGSQEPFEGTSTEYYNLNNKGTKVPVSQYQGGKLSNDYNLVALDEDPFHNTTDNLQQMFAQSPGYWGRETPDMGGFILNNANPQVMQTFSPQQLPVLNGLAKHFAISDQWFSSIPGGTDVNRAFSLTGSAFNMLGTWEGGNPYEYWPDAPHRQSLWKTLWSQGITDWKIYNSVLWENYIFTYQLYLKGQVPSVDSNPTQYLSSLDQFKNDARHGCLPAFSYLEPAWIAPEGSTSYHAGGDPVPAEQTLNDIYEAIKAGPGWKDTLLVVTFDKNGGVYDHVAPPYAKKPWPNDLNNGFAYDLMGPRVPTIMVSPWIKEKSVIRAEGETPFDSTSFAATLLDWFGVPKPLWGLGDRMESAPTFEAVFQESTARQGGPTFTPPYDKAFPKKP